MSGRGTYKGIVDTKTHLELRIQELEKLLIVYAKPWLPLNEAQNLCIIIDNLFLGLFYIA